METMRVIWIISFAAFLIIEISTVNLMSIWFCFGSVAALISQMAGAPLIVQLVVFVLVSLAFLILTKPFIKKLAIKTVKTNADRILDLKGIVTEEINNIKGNGAIKVDGKIWTARSFENEEIIPVGKEVNILEIQGVKAIVKQI